MYKFTHIKKIHKTLSTTLLNAQNILEQRHQFLPTQGTSFMHQMKIWKRTKETTSRIHDLINTCSKQPQMIFFSKWSHLCSPWSPSNLTIIISHMIWYDDYINRSRYTKFNPQLNHFSFAHLHTKNPLQSAN